MSVFCIKMKPIKYNIPVCIHAKYVFTTYFSTLLFFFFFFCTFSASTNDFIVVAPFCQLYVNRPKHFFFLNHLFMKTSSLIGRFISTVYCMLFLLCLVYTVVVSPGIFFFWNLFHLKKKKRF